MVTLQGTSSICHLNVDVDAARLALQSMRDGGSGSSQSTYGGEWFRSEYIWRGVVQVRVHIEGVVPVRVHMEGSGSGQSTYGGEWFQSEYI